ncbi:MAG: Cof-type HAD-IIB family hydrolase [Angelakisella sp.]
MRLFASDLDGTLLNESFGIDQENLTAIRALEDAGIRFAIATGRAYYDVVGITEQYGLRCAVICNNGACVYDADGRLIHKSAVPPSMLRKLCNYLHDNGIFFGINSLTALNLLTNWEEILRGEICQSSEQEFCRVKEVVLSQKGLRFIDSFEEFISGSIDGCSVSVMGLIHSKLENLMEFVRSCDGLAMTVSGYNSLEIAVAGSSKADALGRLAFHLGIPQEQTVAVGHNYNDLEMLKTAAISFAMENAPQDIKDISTYVTASHKDHGVAQAIYNILDGGQTT